MTVWPRKRLWLPVLCVCGTVLFTGLGAWQIQRLGWKRELIRRVESRVAATPVQAPQPADWNKLKPGEYEYRRVVARGVYLHEQATLVDALTVRGPGSWVLTPLRTGEGVIMVNRGFVPQGWRGNDTDPATRPDGEVTVTGLLRATEPRGRLLRANDPQANRWFSRDVAAIASTRGLDQVAPFFIDAGAGSSVHGGPAGGLTVVHFRNAHLAYAATWFSLAALCAGGLVLTLRKPP